MEEGWNIEFPYLQMMSCYMQAILSPQPYLMQLSNDYRKISGYKTIATKPEVMMSLGVWLSQLENQFRFHYHRLPCYMEKQKGGLNW